MTTTASGTVRSPRVAFERFAAGCAVLSGIAGPLYGVTFVLLGSVGSSAVVLMLGGMLTAGALVGLFGRLRAVDGGLATLALVLGAAGALGATVHGGLDLATTLHPVAGALADAPNAVDPRGLLTFGVAGLGSLLVGWLVLAGAAFPRGLGYLAVAAGVLMVLLYLARLIVLNPASPLVLVPALLTGFLVVPLFYLWAGWCLYHPVAGRASGH